MPYILHPDKVTAVEQLVMSGKTKRINKKAKTPAKRNTIAADPGMVAKLAQKLFLERIQKQQGIL